MLLLLALLALPAQADSPQAAPAPASTCESIRTLLAADQAHWGLSVTTLTGSPLCQINAGELFHPASNAKLFTASAALALLGPNRTWFTEVLSAPAADTPFRAGDATLTGDLRLVGTGDAFLSTRPMPYSAVAQPPAPDPLAAMADRIAASGLRHITGAILADDTAMPYQPYPPEWTLDDTLWGYGAPVSALTVYDNKLHLTLHGAHDPTTTPQVPVTGPPALTFHVRAGQSLTISRDPLHPTEINLTGSTSFGDDDLAIPDPALFAAETLTELLRDRGIEVDHAPRVLHSQPRSTASDAVQLKAQLLSLTPKPEAMPDADALALHTSPPLNEDVTLTLKVSQNLHAELLLRHLGGALGTEATTIQGARVVRAFLLRAGIPAADFTLPDGSGLSTHALATPRAFTDLLVYAAAQPWFPDFRAALPVAGEDGSLAGRFTTTLKGRVQAKTGTTAESRALSGYLTTAAGQTLCFSILVDDHLPETTANRTLMDQVLELLASAN